VKLDQIPTSSFQVTGKFLSK